MTCQEHNIDFLNLIDFNNKLAIFLWFILKDTVVKMNASSHTVSLQYEHLYLISIWFVSIQSTLVAWHSASIMLGIGNTEINMTQFQTSGHSEC